jgi:hypothetical protein
VEALIGDRIDIRGQHVGEEGRHGEIIDVKGPGGAPPYLVHWSDGHEGLFFPGPDAVIEHVTSDPSQSGV